MIKRIRRNDIILILCVGILLFAAYVGFSFWKGKEGAYVVITIDGDEYQRISLQEQGEYPISIDGKETNRLRIENGKAYMVHAACPDQLCIHQKSIAKEKETIVCLPNKVVVTVIGGEENELDSFVK